jgi:hypothetical protein
MDPQYSADPHADLADTERKWREAVESVYEALSANPTAEVNLFKLFAEESDARQLYAQALRAAGRPVPDQLRQLAPLPPDLPSQRLDPYL